MRYLIYLPLAGVIGVLTILCPAGAQTRLPPDGPQFELRDMAARIVITPENRTDIDIRVRYGKVKVPTLMVSHRGNVTVLNGHLNAAGHGFNLYVDGHHDGKVQVQGLGLVDIADLPLVFVRVPVHAAIKDSAHSFGRIGPSQSLDFVMNGSGDWAIEPVAGPLNIINSGSGMIHVASAADSIIDSMGSGDIDLGMVRNLKIVLTGSGNFHVGQSHDTLLQNQGSGDVTLARTGNLKAQLNGSSALSLGDVDGALTVINSGTGDVNARQVSGPVTLDLSGSGDVSIDAGQIPAFVLKGSGSGDVRFGGTTALVNIDNNGSGNIRITKATGPVVTKVIGSGDTHIGH